MGWPIVGVRQAGYSSKTAPEKHYRIGAVLSARDAPTLPGPRRGEDSHLPTIASFFSRVWWADALAIFYQGLRPYKAPRSSAGVLHTLTRSTYSPVRVSILIVSPDSTNSGTLTVAPVSSVAAFSTLVAVSPR